MRGHLFIFGNTPQLSHAELTVFFPSNQLIASEVALVTEDLSASECMARLGGTVKIAKVLAQVSTIAAEPLVELLPKLGGSRISFGISSYSQAFQLDTKLLQSMKGLLQQRGLSVRYLAPREGQALTSVQVAKQHLIELLIVGKPGAWIIGQTVAVQDFEAWNRRDYGRPAASPKAGMLPPKVARMAVNLASGQVGQIRQKILLDPFCGVGTILGEALLTGWKVIGADQLEEAVGKARKNLEWLKPQGSWNLLVSDATHISQKLQPESVDSIVTEPYLGKANLKFKMQNAKLEDIKNNLKGLEKLYIGCLKNWQNILKPDGKVVIALPEYAISHRTYFVKKVIDICETLGYTLLTGPIAYHRPQAIVRRMFCVFAKLD